MVAVHSTMVPLGTRAPDFQLADPEGRMVSLQAYDGVSAYVIMFICNHCPFVKLLKRDIATIAREYADREVAFIAINSNDWRRYPDDAPEKMLEDIRHFDYTFPYLCDDTQEVAKAYRAACTPDFYVYDGNLRLTYRGQFDEARPGNGLLVSGADLRAAIDATLDGEPIPNDVQKPSIGCNIKWLAGQEPDYFRP